MKSTTYLLVGVLVAIAIVAIIKKHFFEVADYDLLTQGNALRFGIEGYEDAEASEMKTDTAEHDEDDDEEVYEGYEDDEEDEGDVEHMTTAAKGKREKKKVQAKLRAAAKMLKAKKKAPAAKAPVTAPATAAAPTTAPVTATATPEKFENTSRFQELKAKWDAYKAKTGPALTEEERNELLALLDMPDEPVQEESFEQFEEMPYQGTEYAMF